VAIELFDCKFIDAGRVTALMKLPAHFIKIQHPALFLYFCGGGPGKNLPKRKI
jgi:hypothetical protein